jgi:hypothetical protein
MGLFFRTALMKQKEWEMLYQQKQLKSAGVTTKELERK